MKFLCIVLLFLPLTALVSAQETRTLTDRQGRSFQAEILTVNEKEVQVKRTQDGRTFTIALSTLSEQDQAYFQEQAAASTGDAAADSKNEALNQALQFPLFSADSSFWQESSSTVAKRIQWPQESLTDYTSSYRIYPKEPWQVLGCQAYTACLYAQDDQAEMISILFANKGDTPGSNQSLDKMIREDADRIQETLTRILGEPSRDSFGKGKGFRERVSRWQHNDTAFLLSEQDENYLSLRITTTELADNKGLAKKLTTSEIRDRVRQNVEEREQGDVLLTNMPMVNQGPKGYCVPATFERYLRYLSLPADMYLIAMNAQTTAGGGTNMHNFLDGISSYVNRFNRSVKTIRGDIDIRTVSKYIDKGFPLMWTLYSSPPFNQAANEQSKLRKSNWTEWLEQSKTLARSAKKTSLPREGGHIVIIHGYNKETGEIAFTDSWGPRFAERWILLEQANQAAFGELYYVNL